MIRVFPRKTTWTPTDELSFVGDPPLSFLRPPPQPVHISVTFTWDIPEGERLLKAWSIYYGDVQLGGPAFDDPGGPFEPGRFVKNGVTITSRGCPKCCPFCFVPRREGKLRELPIRDGWILADNNLFACSKEHLERVFAMLRRQPEAAKFKGGLDATLLNDWHLELFESIRIRELWFACDTPKALMPLERVASMIERYPRRSRRCYVLIGFNGESIDEAQDRLKSVYDLGFLPFAQLYRGPSQRNYAPAWKALARTWSRPAIYKRLNKNPEEV